MALEDPKTRDVFTGGKGTQNYGTGKVRNDQETGGKGTQNYSAKKANAKGPRTGASRDETGGKGVNNYSAKASKKTGSKATKAK